MIGITVITPTIGRLSLRRTLVSVAEQMGNADEHIVIGDGPQVEARAMCHDFERVRYIQGPRTNHYGNAQRDVATAQARGDYLLFCDDDDRLADGALEAVRDAALATPDMPLAFRMQTSKVTVWHQQILRPGNVGGGQFVVPRVAVKLPLWVNGDEWHQYSDFAYILQAVKAFGGVEWREELILHVG